MAKIPYSKPALSYSDQLSKLKQRGLIISNDNKALHLLEQLSYYRLSGYWYPLLQIPKSNHQFKPNSKFDHAFKMYCFDRKLRSLILSQLEKIEISLRAKMIYILSMEYGPHWHVEPSHFNRIDRFNKVKDKIKIEISRSDEEFLINFKSKYSDELPPSWISFEVSSFGTISMLYSNLKPVRAKRSIANFYGLNEKYFESWIHTLVYIRNVCAHHSRLWNKELQISPQKPRTVNPKSGRPYPFPSKDWIDTSSVNVKRLYMSISIIGYFLQTVNPHNSFKSKLSALFTTYPSINIGAMNFPSNWQSEPLWS